MLSLRKPTDAEAQSYLAARKNCSHSYCGGLVGASRDQCPAGYAIGHYRVQLGTGSDVFDQAKQAIRQWRMFPGELIELHPNRPTIDVGADVALRIHAMGLWALAACRVVYTVDETTTGQGTDVERFGFAYGTLPGHVEQGEERFLVEWDRADDRVTYDLMAFSRPDNALVWMGLPIARYYQRRFAILSCRAMMISVNSSSTTSEGA